MNDVPPQNPDEPTPEEGPSGVKRVTAEEVVRGVVEKQKTEAPELTREDFELSAPQSVLEEEPAEEESFKEEAPAWLRLFEEEEPAPPPQNLLVEDEILGNVLFPGPNRMPELVALGLKPHHFASRASSEIYSACLALHQDGFEPSVAAVSEIMRQSGTLKMLQGREEFLFDLLHAQALPPRRLEKSVRDIISLWQRREATKIALRSSSLLRGAESLSTEAILADAKASNDALFEERSGAVTISELIKQMAQEGPLIHEPTGLQTLDGLTMNGPVYGTRWVVQGAPDAGKTALLVQWADLFMRRGIPVGFLAIDEEPIDLLTRLVQRAGFTRTEAEKRDPKVLAAMRDLLSEFPIRFYDADFSIEAAASDLRNHFPDKPAAFFIDSLQTAHCDTQNDRMGLRELVTANVNAMRAVTKRYKPMAVIATSEMTREAYRNEESKKATDKMSTGKESGKIEYGAKVLLSLTSVTGKPDVVELEVTKNKHGPSRVKFYLKIDRVRQELAETEAPGEADGPVVDELLVHACGLVDILLRQPGCTIRDVYAALRGRYTKFSESRANTVMAKLDRGLVKLPEKPKRGQAQHLYLFGERIPGDVLAALEATVRAEAYRAVPPKIDAPESEDDVDLE